METNIMEIHKNGLEITLMNPTSKWRIKHMGDISKTCLWYSPQRIELKEKEDGEFALVNLETFALDEIEVSRIW